MVKLLVRGGFIGTPIPHSLSALDDPPAYSKHARHIASGETGQEATWEIADIIMYLFIGLPIDVASGQIFIEAASGLMYCHFWLFVHIICAVYEDRGESESKDVLLQINGQERSHY